MTKLREGLVAMVVGAALASVLLVAEPPDPLTPGDPEPLHADGTRPAGPKSTQQRQSDL